MQLRAYSAAFLVLTTMNWANSASAQQAGKPFSAAQQQVLDTVKTIFVASESDDMAKFHSVVAPGFYIFDNGRRFDGDAIMELIQKLQTAGSRYEWNVTDPDVHVNGNNAWIAYINRGSITNASGKHEQQWLESAVLQKQAGAWKIVFMQSTRVPQAVPETPGKSQ